MKAIPLSHMQVAIVDDEDYDWLCQWKWYALKTRRGVFYATRNTPIGDGRRRTVYMARVILEAPAGIEVDHADGNGLNNTKGNLRLATRMQNGRNLRKRRNVYTSVYKGVSWSADKQKWRAVIFVNQRQVFLGRFTDELEAARAYNIAASGYFGEFAHLNPIEGDLSNDLSS